MAEQFRLEQVIGYCRAVDLDERLRRAQSVEMQRTGNQLLAGTSLPGHQHRRQFVAGDPRFGVENLPYPGLDLFHRRRVADQPLQAALLGLAPVVGGQRALHLHTAQGPLDRQLQFGQRHRLGQIVGSTELHRIDRGLHALRTGHEDHAQVAVHCIDLFHQLQPGQARQHDVGNDDVGMGGFERLERLFRSQAVMSLPAVALQENADVLCQGFVILDDQCQTTHCRPPRCQS